MSIKKEVRCNLCGNSLDKDQIGLSKKLLDSKGKRIYCINCLSSHLDVTVQDLLDKIEEFKDEGCTLFK